MDEREEEGICLGGGDEVESEDTMAIDSCSSKPTDDIGKMQGALQHWFQRPFSLNLPVARTEFVCDPHPGNK